MKKLLLLPLLALIASCMQATRDCKDFKTGKKNTLLTNFEKKYKDLFLRKMEEYNTTNLWTKFKQLPEEVKQNEDLIKALNDKGVKGLSLDVMPRISRAQSMDVLSSQSNLSGYKSVICGADNLGKIFPMLTTAAGTITPAKVLIFGVGVAGLQAIATAKRLGAQVEATDVRPECKEQTESLGAKFISVDGEGLGVKVVYLEKNKVLAKCHNLSQDLNEACYHHENHFHQYK